MNKGALLLSKITLLSLGFSLAFGASAFMLAPKSWIVSVYLWPGTIVGSALAKVVPSAWMYGIVPEGGAPAFLLLVLIGSFLSWGLLFVVCQALWWFAWRGGK